MVRRWVSSLALLFLCAAGTWAQSTATLSGVVTDPSGAVVPGAHVTVHSITTGTDRELVADSAGLYTAASLQPGDYSVRAAATGFSNNVVPKVTLTEIGRAHV